MTMKIALLLVFLFLLRSDAFLFRPYRPPQPIDCAWLPWTYSRCVQIRKGVYKQEEVRSKIKAQNGGEDCTPEPTRRISNKTCTEHEYLTSLIITTMGTITNLYAAYDIGAAVHVETGANEAYLTMANDYNDGLCPEHNTSLPSGVTLTGYNCSLMQNVRRKRAYNPHRPFMGGLLSIEHRDVLFLIDESSSVGNDNFQMELEFVKELARKFCNERSISLQKTRLALTTFTDDYVHHIDFDDYTDEQSFRTAVDRVNYRGGNTCLVKAIEGVRDEMFTVRKGSRVDNISSYLQREADGLIVLVTDGCFNCFHGDLEAELRKQQQLIEAKGIFLMAFMINDDGSCKQKFQYLYEGSVCFQGFSYPSWEAFQDQIDGLKRQRDCIDRWDKNDEDCP